MKAVIFDLDGTMFDTQKIFALAWDWAGEKLGFGKAGYMIEKTFGKSIAASKDIWTAEFGKKFDEQELRRLTKAFLTEYYQTRYAPVKKGLIPLLQYLRAQHFKLAVATSSPRWEMEHHLHGEQLEELFDVLVCGDMVERSKPDPEIYLQACELLGERSENCYAVEDSKSGLFSAYRAGCRPIMVPDLWQPDDETERILHKKFNDLNEVRAYFEGSSRKEDL